MAKARVEMIQVPVAVAISAGDLRSIDETIGGEIPAQDKLRDVVANLVRQLLDGGMMISPDSMERIRGMFDDPEVTPDDLITRLQDGANRKQGKVCGYWELDPAYLEPMKAIANLRGETVDQIVQECMNVAIDQGWLYTIENPPQRMVFAPGDYKFLQDVLGTGTPTGEDLCEFLRMRQGITDLFDEATDAPQQQHEETKPEVADAVV